MTKIFAKNVFKSKIKIKTSLKKFRVRTQIKSQITSISENKALKEFFQLLQQLSQNH